MKFWAALFVIFLVVEWAGAQADPGPPPAPAPLRLPAEVRAAPQTVIKLRAETATQKVRWRSLDPGLTLLDRDDLRDQREMRAFACAPGRYRVVAWCAAGDDATELVETVVVVEGSPPPVPPPGPDLFAEAIKAAYLADTGSDKAAALGDLAAVWRLAVGYARSPQDATIGALMARVKAAGNSLARDRIKAVRECIAEELTAQFGNPAAPLDKDAAAKAAALFDRIATTLENLK